jgi:hypothetical protein
LPIQELDFDNFDDDSEVETVNLYGHSMPQSDSQKPPSPKRKHKHKSYKGDYAKVNNDSDDENSGGTREKSFNFNPFHRS